MIGAHYTSTPSLLSVFGVDPYRASPLRDLVWQRYPRHFAAEMEMPGSAIEGEYHLLRACKLQALGLEGPYDLPDAYLAKHSPAVQPPAAPQGARAAAHYVQATPAHALDICVATTQAQPIAASTSALPMTLPAGSIPAPFIMNPPVLPPSEPLPREVTPGSPHLRKRGRDEGEEPPHLTRASQPLASFVSSAIAASASLSTATASSSTHAKPVAKPRQPGSPARGRPPKIARGEDEEGVRKPAGTPRPAGMRRVGRVPRLQAEEEKEAIAAAEEDQAMDDSTAEPATKIDRRRGKRDNSAAMAARQAKVAERAKIKEEWRLARLKKKLEKQHRQRA